MRSLSLSCVRAPIPSLQNRFTSPHPQPIIYATHLPLKGPGPERTHSPNCAASSEARPARRAHAIFSIRGGGGFLLPPHPFLTTQRLQRSHEGTDGCIVGLFSRFFCFPFGTLLQTKQTNNDFNGWYIKAVKRDRVHGLLRCFRG